MPWRTVAGRVTLPVVVGATLLLDALGLLPEGVVRPLVGLLLGADAPQP